jgi:ankyrin repeat protein
MARKKAKAKAPAAVTMLVPHARPDLAQLLQAAMLGRERAVRAYLESGGSPNVSGLDRLAQPRPLLHAAVIANDVGSVNCLLAAGADPDVTDKETYTALAVCVMASPDLTVLRALLAGGADVRKQCGPDGLCAVHHAATQDRAAAVIALLEVHGDVDVRTAKNVNAFNIAARHGHLHLVKQLHRAGAGVNTPCGGQEQWKPLLAAGRAGHVDVMTHLLDEGADLVLLLLLRLL